MKKVLTGLQPSGSLTLGNYIGSIRQMKEYQDKYESYLFVADMHAITVPQNPAELSANIRSLVSVYLASGIDPAKNTIYVQSENPYHANLGWVIECNTPYGELSRMTQFKDKSRRNEHFFAGLLTYPALMAADILMYDADYVPVGADQKQHVEMARDAAVRFNKTYGDTFVVPEPLINAESAKIYDLQNPAKKMSKSGDQPKGIIFLTDTPDEIAKKVKSAVTDSEGEVRYDPVAKPGVSNLIVILSSLTGRGVAEIEKDYSGYGAFKTDVAQAVIETLTPVRERYAELVRSGEVDDILDRGGEVTREIARKKTEAVFKAVGLWRRLS
ncbi:tryptophan--tRNA ligase [Clostridia bacterium]|nr:tryptophan--tRNA ligase [Clostridia bacterium]